jgi:hypothetical protein
MPKAVFHILAIKRYSIKVQEHRKKIPSRTQLDKQAGGDK